VQFIEFYHNQTQYVLIDTPGFNDTYRSDVDILKEISASLAITYRQNIKLVGVVFLQSILQPRMQGSAMRNLKMFDKLCGQGYLEKITLVSSFWDEVELDAGLHREAELGWWLSNSAI
jgi:superfamily I DNA/RNA helicase